MPFAVALVLDPAADGAVRALGQRLAATRLPGLPTRSTLPAHISLAAGDGLDVEHFRPVLAQIAAATSRLPCTLAVGIPPERMPTAVGVCQAAFRPIAGLLTQVSLAELDPVRPRYAFDLSLDR